MNHSANPATNPQSQVLLPVVRRLMQVGRGPTELAGWLRAQGVSLTPRPDWTPADERAARSLALQLTNVVRPNAVRGGGGQSFATLPHHLQETIRPLGLRVEGR